MPHTPPRPSQQMRPLSTSSTSPAKTIAVAAAIARDSGGTFTYKNNFGADGEESRDDSPKPEYRRSKSDVGPRTQRRGSSSSNAAGDKPSGGRGILGAVRKGLGRLANGMRKRLPSPRRQASPRGGRASVERNRE